MFSFIKRISRNPSKGSGREATDDTTQIKQLCSVISSSEFFDREFYLRQISNEALAGMDPAQHYACHGAFAGFDPGPRFSTEAYLSAYPDVAASGMNALVHYERYGRAEGRKCITASNSSEFVKNAIKAISDCSKYEYARMLDSLAEALLPEALAGYPSETYAKLMILRICNILMLKHASYHGHLGVASMPLTQQIRASCNVQDVFIVLASKIDLIGIPG